MECFAFMQMFCILCKLSAETFSYLIFIRYWEFVHVLASKWFCQAELISLCLGNTASSCVLVKTWLCTWWCWLWSLYLKLCFLSTISAWLLLYHTLGLFFPFWAAGLVSSLLFFGWLYCLWYPCGIVQVAKLLLGVLRGIPLSYFLAPILQTSSCHLGESHSFLEDH